MKYPDFSSTYVKVFIEKSKTDIYREGVWAYISSSSKICPLKQLQYYLALAKVPENSEEFIFRGLSRGKNSVCAQKLNRFHKAEFERFLLKF